MATKKKAEKVPAKKSAPKKKAPAKKKPGSKKEKADPGNVVQAWERGESIECSPDTSND